ncbi:MAG: two-component regulator propeller domain-containing protein [Breznakibacter sp.]
MKYLLAFFFWWACVVGIYAQNIRYLGVDDGLNGRNAFNFQQDRKGFIWISTRFGVDRYDGRKVKNYPLPIVDEKKYPFRVVKVVADNDSSIWAFTDRGAIYRYNEKSDQFECRTNLKRFLRAMIFDGQNRLWVASKAFLGYMEGDSLYTIGNPMLATVDIKMLGVYDDQNLWAMADNAVLTINRRNGNPSLLADAGAASVKAVFESAYFDPENSILWLGTIDSGLFMLHTRTGGLTHVTSTRDLHSPILKIYPIDETSLFIGTDGQGALMLDRRTLTVRQSYRQHEGIGMTLSDDGVYDIFRDREGRFWLSTYYNGVNIFDFGQVGFYVIRHEANKTNSLSKDNVGGFLETADGSLWIGTTDGISVLNRTTGQWQQLMQSKNVMVLYQDSRGNIWAGTYADGLYMLNPNGTVIGHFVNQPGNPQSLGTNFIYTISEDSRGDIWVGGKKGKISRYNPKINTFTRIDQSQTNYILQKDANTVLFACETGMFEYSLETERYRRCTFTDSIASNYVCDAVVESDSIIWLALYGGGINRCNYYTGEVRQFGTQSGLPSDFVYALLVDDRQHIWFSTENGIGKLNTQTYQINNFSVGDGISDQRFRQLSRLKTKDGFFFFGSFGGVTYFHPNEIRQQRGQAHVVLLDLSLFNQIVHAGDKGSPLASALDDTEKIILSHKQHSFSMSFTSIDFSPAAERRFMWMLEGLDEKWVGPTSETVLNYTNLEPRNYVLRLKSIGNNNEVVSERQIAIVVSPPFWKTTWAKVIGVFLWIILVYLVIRYIRYTSEKRQSEAKVRFFINTAHDIRTPLTLISAPIYELKEKIPTNSHDGYLLNLVTSNLEKLNKMFAQLLDFQKVFEDKERLEVKPHHVNDYFRTKKEYWLPLASNKHVGLSVQMPSGPLDEWFDAEKMDKILDNLVFNSLKYTPEGGRIDVVLTSSHGHWQVDVSDTGIGIPKVDMKKLFHRFYRAQNAINSQETGSGLGLMLVKSYVELHGGTISVQSAEGVGTSFVLKFKHGNGHFKNIPFVHDVSIVTLEDGTTEESISEAGNTGIRLLIVEDNKDLREYMKMSLGHYYKTYVAENGQVAWNMIPTINPDLVVSDLQMPEMDGMELCRKIKGNFESSHIPVILLTVMTDKVNMEQGLLSGAEDYIPKPFDVKYLRVKIDNIIQNRKLLRAKFLDVDRANTSVPDHENGLNQQFISRVDAIIQENMANSDFSVNDLSKEMGLSRTLLYAKFNSITGCTPNDYIKIVRMKKAIRLFREKRYTINEVAHMTGFSEPSYFATCFKKTYGKSPSQFIGQEIG